MTVWTRPAARQYPAHRQQFGSPPPSSDGAFDDDYVDLGPLKGNIGDQNYVVPEGVDATSYTSVVVWCDRFNVSFGAAELKPA